MTQSEIDLSVVVPVRDEAANILPLIEEIHAALATHPAFEIVYVDDGSRDATPERLAEARQRFPRLRSLVHAESCGQSAAIRTGVHAARGRLVATLDGDGQNDPADLPALIDAYAAGAPERRMVAGQRVDRRDSWIKRKSSRIANAVRSRLLGDDTKDTGCGLKVFERATYLDLPFFDHQHRFLPALMQREGYRVGHVPVRHRRRERGQSKYGTLDRLLVGVVDLAGVWWLKKRRRIPSSITEM